MANKKNVSGGKKKSNTTNDLATFSKKCIISYLIMLGFLVLSGVALINMKDSGKEHRSDTSAIWQKSYEKAEKNKGELRFNEINTTEAEYDRLRLECNKFIEQDKKGKKIDAKVDVDTKINEVTFTDGAKSVGNEAVVENKNTMIETGPIYLDNKLIVRYLNKKGELNIVTAVFKDSRKESIEVLKQYEIANYMRTKESMEKLIQRPSANVDNKDTEDEYTSEESFLNSIGNTLIGIISAKDDKELLKIKNDVIKYFTIEGKDTVINNKQSMGVTDKSVITMYYAIGGKSDTKLTYKDRVYMQLRVNNGGKEHNINLIIKLNKNYAIFDIDMI